MKSFTGLCRQAALFCCLLLIAAPFAQAEDKTPSAGAVRVWLTSLGLTDRADLTLDGSYTCGEMAFQQGSRVTVRLQDGDIYLYYEGMVRNMGKEALFLRHQLPGQDLNGIRVNGNYALYCGDLIFSDRGGQLMCVARMDPEEYLLGVLPYEMSSSFPLEALKAQAVTARSYALSLAAPDRPYDVEDNTNDQVFGGITENSSVIRRAVRETEGVCVFYRGKIVPCYYTASNGGMVESIENVWGVSRLGGYIRRRTDPYDLKNPESPVRILTLPRDWTVSRPTEELKTVITEALAEPLKTLGMSPAPEDIVILGIDNAEMRDETDEGSGIFQTLRLTVRVTGKRLTAPDGEEEVEMPGLPVQTETAAPQASASPSPLTRQVTLDLSYFGQVEAPFYLSINGSNNELTSIRQTDKAFVLEARRFGHGVGLSQRGAQYMAEREGWSYRQIIRYYYQDITFQKVRCTYKTADRLDAVFQSTPAPPATPTPRPTLMPVTAREGEYLVIVDQVATDSSLNLRREPSTTSDILLRLYYGQTLAVTGEQGDWIRVRTDSAEGYVMARYVSRIGEE